MAVVLAVTAVVVLAVASVLGPDASSPWLRAIYLVAQWIGPLVLVSLAAWTARRRLSTWVRHCLIELAGPALVSAMPPRTVLNAVLARVFGDKVGYQEIATALLGGSGRDPAARDTAVSKGTTVTIRFERVDEYSCLTAITWSHEFSGVRNNHHYVMFATTDADILTIVNSERAYPLFEAWRVGQRRASGKLRAEPQGSDRRRRELSGTRMDDSTAWIHNRSQARWSRSGTTTSSSSCRVGSTGRTLSFLASRPVRSRSPRPCGRIGRADDAPDNMRSVPSIRGLALVGSLPLLRAKPRLQYPAARPRRREARVPGDRLDAQDD